MAELLGYVTLAVVAATLFFAWRTYEVARESFRRDQEFECVPTQELIDSLACQWSSTGCIPIAVEARNLSRWSRSVSAMVTSNGLCLHFDGDPEPPPHCLSALTLPTYIVAPGQN